MGTENDIESFIQLQKQKLAQERENLHPKLDYGQGYEPSQPYSQKPNGSTDREPLQQKRATQGEVTPAGSSLTAPRFGEYDQKRKKLDEERKREYNEINQRKTGRQNAPNNARNGDNDADGDLFSKLGQYEARRKVLDVERNNEYNKKLAKTEYRRTGRPTDEEGPSIPGLRDHPSANQQKMKERNAEYNEFLKSQQQKISNRFADKKNLPVEPVRQPEPARLYQNGRRGETTPRQANGSYEELLEEKRRQEQTYRRRNDPDSVRTDARRTYPPADRRATEGRFDDLDRQIDRRKVKFANDRANEDSTDVYDWLKKVKQKFGVGDLPTPTKEYSTQGRSRSFYHDPEPKVAADPYERSRSVPPKEQQMTGLAIGHDETASAARKRKEQYRHELEQQMSLGQRQKHRGGYPPENAFTATPRDNLFQQPVKPAFSEQPASILDDRRPLASILNERRDLVDTSPRGNAVRLGLGPGVLERGFTGLYEPSILSQPAQPQVQQPNGYGGAQQPYQTSADAAYNYYGTHDPLAGFTAPPLGAPQYPNQQIPTQPTPRPNQRPAQSFPSQPQANKPSAAVGAFPSEGGNKGQQKKESQQTYQQELRRQMEEKQRIQAAKKAEQEAYDKKLNAEIANYNPFGRGGAGAPMKDTTGNVIADLRSMKLANDGQTPRPEVQNAPSQPLVNAPAQFDPKVPSLNISAGADALDGLAHARGGHGIFGEPKTEVQKTAADKYKEELQKQIDEKKRVAEMEKQKLKAEEEREMKRLEEDRIKIQKEFEAEQAKAKAKEEETRRKNEEMKAAAEEKRRLAEEQRAQAEQKRKEKEEAARNKREKEEEEDRRLAVQQNQQEGHRASSPPIPTLRAKTQPPGSMEFREPSPPLPTQRAKTQHDQALTDSKPVIRDPQPATSRAPEPAPTSRPVSRAKSVEVLNQLAHMRQQLQQERQRVENALSKQKTQERLVSPPTVINVYGVPRNQQDVDVYDPRERITGPDPLDVFETARSKKPVSARRTSSKLDNINSDPPNELPKPQTATSLLQSDSAFIDDSGMRAAFPDDFETLATNQNARRKRREKMKQTADDEFGYLMREYLHTPASPADMLHHYQQQPRLHRKKDTESVHSVDPDRITRKNQDRLRKLKAIAGDEISLDDPDDIIDRFMTKQNHNRPPSGQTLTDESWINSNR